MRTSKRIIVSIEILLRLIIIIEQISIIKKENLFIKKYIQQEISVEKFTREKVKITTDRYLLERSSSINGIPWYDKSQDSKRSSDARSMHEPRTRMASRQLPVGLESGHA